MSEEKLKTSFLKHFSLGDRFSKDERTFLIKTIIWILILRFLLVFWVWIYPDTRGTVDFITATNPPNNDAPFYFEIATLGYHEPNLVNFSPAFPAIMSVFIPLFQGYTSFVLNTIFVIATPYFLLGFLKNIIHGEKKARIVMLMVLFNPIFFCYSIFGLTEPLHFLLLFVVLNSHYSKGLKHRVIEYAFLVLLMLNRFINIMLAVFYLYKALFSRKLHLKERVLKVVPAVVLGCVYLGWEFFCSKVFGITPSAARAEYWGHHFQFNPLSPTFILQLPVLLSGVVLGITVLQSYFCKDKALIEAEQDSFKRIEIQALLAFVAATLIFLGAINLQISVLRYLGTLFPIFIIQKLEVKTSKHLSSVAFLIYIGMIITSIIAMPAIIYLTSIGALPMIKQVLTASPLEIILTEVLSVILVIAAIKYYRRRFEIKNIDRILAIQILLTFLMMPIALAFP
jgi:hypothetical protein